LRRFASIFFFIAIIRVAFWRPLGAPKNLS
jgi:hypothetical protein